MVISVQRWAAGFRVLFKWNSSSSIFLDDCTVVLFHYSPATTHLNCFINEVWLYEFRDFLYGLYVPIRLFVSHRGRRTSERQAAACESPCSTYLSSFFSCFASQIDATADKRNTDFSLIIHAVKSSSKMTNQIRSLANVWASCHVSN